MGFCPRQDNEATLEVQRRHKAHATADGTCSYCGSMTEERFMQEAQEGAELGPTDKSYKVYVKLKNEKTEKFYFQHLSEENKKKFVDLINDKKLKIGFPGHFCVLPFFIKLG